MNKDKINSKIEDLEAELQKLKQLANEPEKRSREGGDVLLCGDAYWLVTDDGEWVAVEDRDPNVIGTNSGECVGGVALKNLGKFNEVYVKISDVRDALSHKDSFGGCILRSLPWCGLGVSCLEKTRSALRKLNIITD